MKIKCILEHNGDDSLIYAENCVGAFTRGSTPDIALGKMPEEIRSYFAWLGEAAPEEIDTDIVQEKASDLEIKDADNEGSILKCRKRGFELLESTPGFLNNLLQEGSYGEMWSVRKVLRRFIWHDRIHAKAMWRMARKTFEKAEIENIFHFE